MAKTPNEFDQKSLAELETELEEIMTANDPSRPTEAQKAHLLALCNEIGRRRSAEADRKAGR